MIKLTEKDYVDLDKVTGITRDSKGNAVVHVGAWKIRTGKPFDFVFQKIQSAKSTKTGLAF